MTLNADGVTMMLEANGVTAVIDGHHIVTSASIEVRTGEVVGLVGPNGSGKSTLLRCIYRVLRPHGGVIDLDGDNVWALSARAAAQRSGRPGAAQRLRLRRA